jgi:hypothetical protein
MQHKYVKFINHCIFTNMNRVRMVNHTSGNVTYCDRSMIRTLNAIGFVEQPEPSLETEIVEKPKAEVVNTAPKTPTKTLKKNAAKS